MIKRRFTGKPMKQTLQDLKLAVTNDIPKDIKVMAVDFFDKSFVNQGFTNTGYQPWTPRKNERRVVFLGSRESAPKQPESRAILIGPGSRLRKSIQGRTESKAVIVESLNVPYASIHNKGGYAGRGLKAKIPKRQYMGYSKMLYDDIERHIAKKINEVFRK